MKINTNSISRPYLRWLVFGCSTYCHVRLAASILASLISSLIWNWNKIVLTVIFLLAASAAFAADLGTPRLSESLSIRKFFDPERLLITGGVKYEGAEGFTIEPLFGLGYTARERELKVGVDEAIHKVHAQAGGKIDLAKTIYLSAAAKIPVYTYELSDSRTGFGASQGALSRHEYDFIRLSPSTLSWTGEVGIHLGLRTDLTLYYDQDMLNSYQPGLSKSEERFGTRIIFRFK